MLIITIPKSEGFNQQTNEFISTNEITISLEHSLVSIQKWESKWHKPFLSTTDKDRTREETIDYIRCMTKTQNVPKEVYYFLTEENIKLIEQYISDPHTATTFHSNQLNKNPINSKKEIITAEIIYYWMIQYNIPICFETRHLNNLITLIRVCNIKERSSSNKMSKRDTLMSNHMLNQARKAKSGTHG